MNRREPASPSFRVGPPSTPVPSAAHSATPLPTIEGTFSVAWRHRVFFARRVFDAEHSLLREQLTEPAASAAPQAVLVVVDAGLVGARPSLPDEIRAYFAAGEPRLRLAGPPLVLPGGETAKNDPAVLHRVYEEIHRRRIDRHAWIVGVGGGALLDVAGFAASTAHRGCRHVRLPTTTLAQADSGVGIKNGINLFGKKNFVGAFAPPVAVINDLDFLATLPPRERRSGCVEGLKVALIQDARFFAWIEENSTALCHAELERIQILIQRCAELHVRHITAGGDPFETGSARPLDFGHWSAHKLEQLSGYRLGHGEAVAIGIALDTVYAAHTGLLRPETAARILRVLEQLGFHLDAPELDARNTEGERALLDGLDEFREHLGGQLTLTLLRDIGTAIEVHEYQRGRLDECVAELRRRCAASR